ncbi:Uncharacterised protein [Vibrio cholerae]|nr:Uncharacterised protein [Vibrio cholerae]
MASKIAFTCGKVPIPKQATPTANTANNTASVFELTPSRR